MRRYRPKIVHDPDFFPRTYSCTTWRWRSGTLTLLLAATLVVATGAPTPADATHARRSSRSRSAGSAGFITSAPKFMWTSFLRQGERLISVDGFECAGNQGREVRRHCCATRAARPGLLCRAAGGGQRRGESQFPQQLRGTHDHNYAMASSSTSSMLLLATAVDIDVNATVGAEVGTPVASSEVPLSMDAAGTKGEQSRLRQPKQKQKKQSKQAVRTKESTSIEGKEATVIITEAGGRPHTVASKAKISAANKGKKPWNVGVGHSEETRRKIAEGAKNAARKRRQKTAESLGMTLEEYDEMKKRKPVGKRNPEVSEETRKKISTRLKEKWKDPVYREQRKQCMPNRRGVPHSDETKARISAAVKEKWLDPAYREKITNMVRTEETRAKIGKIIKEQWADPETRRERLKNMAPRTEAHNKRIAESVRSKWSDPEYRKRTSEAMRKAAYDRIIASGGVPKPPRIRRPRAPRAPGESRGRSSRLDGVGISREAQRNLNKWAKQRKEAEVRLMRQSKKDQKALEAATKRAIKEAKAEAERLALEEEAALTEGLDDLEKVLMRSTIRAKKQERMAKVAKAAAKAKAAASPKMEEPDEPDEPDEPMPDVPEGFEMVEINGRMVMRMK